jgi:hypothetical protein
VIFSVCQDCSITAIERNLFRKHPCTVMPHKHILLLVSLLRHSADESVPCLHGSARAKSDLFKERYSVLHQVIVGMTT